VFVASKVWAVFAASGVVLGAAYMLSLYQRTMFGRIENPKNERLLDLDMREFVTFAPLLVLAVWMGLYPAPILRRLDTSVAHIMARVNPQYAQAYAMDCGGGALSPAALAGTPPGGSPASAAPAAAGAQPGTTAGTTPASTSSFLVATPCGPDGKPLPNSGAPR